MKTKLFFLSMLLALFPASGAEPTKLLELSVVNVTTNPAALTTNYLSGFTRATFYGKLQARTNNTATVYIGTSTNFNAQPIAISPGAAVVVEAPPGQIYYLRDFWMQVPTTNDGVYILYSPGR